MLQYFEQGLSPWFELGVECLSVFVLVRFELGKGLSCWFELGIKCLSVTEILTKAIIHIIH